MWSDMYIGIHVKYPLFLARFNETWIFSTDFRKLRKYKMKHGFSRQSLENYSNTNWNMYFLDRFSKTTQI